MKECIFCKIITGEIPCYKVYEDESFLAFLDIRPTVPGHTLLIPKKHYRWVWDINEEYTKPAQKIALALKTVFETDYVVSFVMGEEVPHAHIHLVPRKEDDGHGPLINLRKTSAISSEEMNKIAQKIASYC